MTPTQFTTQRIGAGRLVMALVTEDDGSRYVGVAWCAPSDQFDRKKGRVAAEGRARRRRTSTRRVYLPNWFELPGTDHRWRYDALRIALGHGSRFPGWALDGEAANDISDILDAIAAARAANSEAAQ